MAKAWHCSNCGSKNVTVSGTARWDEVKQDWVLDDIDDSIDNDLCYDCDDYHPGEFRDLTDLKAAAQAAITANDTTYSEDQHGIPQ
jgi:hypothetical protein